ncbi:hypothetical protein Mycsm_07245 (plasmid) [Mycobacterium sp. JS623]|uniref:hypothetical protein n=1 Tax=Mycobacterium sp. JS623 TaxID=212767 RepID=UPI0002A5A5CF|nr:hypothetical protein [Mycobacterium sp. JS623]AGB27339.1 hypothetical protein Mycsm_07245 [Mycobacterium sp. JS623]
MSGIRPARAPQWTRRRLVAMLLECYGPTPRGSVDVAAVAHYAAVSPSTVRRWLGKPSSGSRRVAIPKLRLRQLQCGPEEVERRNEQQYRHALAAMASIDDEAKIVPVWREQGWLDQHSVVLLAIHHRPWHQVAVTNGSRRALNWVHRRGATIDNMVVPTRFHAIVLAHTVMARQQAWRVHPAAHRLATGRTQVWMDDAPAVDLATLAAASLRTAASGDSAG